MSGVFGQRFGRKYSRTPLFSISTEARAAIHSVLGFDVSPDGRGLWTADAQDGTLSVLDVTSRTLSATLDAKTFGANRLKFTPDGKLVLISMLGNGDLVIYDTASRKEFKRVKIGHGAAGILMDRDGNRAFIACGPDNYVAVLDLQCESTFTTHIADCDYAQHSLTTGVLLR